MSEAEKLARARPFTGNIIFKLYCQYTWFHDSLKRSFKPRMPVYRMRLAMFRRRELY